MYIFTMCRNLSNYVKKHAFYEVSLLTASGILRLPGVDRVFSRAPIHQTPEISRSRDIPVRRSFRKLCL